MTTTTTEHEINSIKHRISTLEKNETIDRYATYIADAVEHLSAFSSSNRLDAVKNHLEAFAKEITNINNR
jgi:hypothetical protein